MFLQIFQYDVQFFHHSSALFNTPVQFASISGLQLVYPGMADSLALSEELSTLRKVSSFACKMDRSAVNVAFAIIEHFEMSLFHDAQYNQCLPGDPGMANFILNQIIGETDKSAVICET